MSNRRLTSCATALALCAIPVKVSAQACCAAPNVVVPSRLAREEVYGVGLQARGRGVFGTFGADGAFARTTSGDVETAQELFAAVRPLARAQVAVIVPFVETRRHAPGLSDFGGGLGDVRAAVHVEVVRDGERRTLPGVALLLGASFPTGRAPDEANGVLAADATGTGALEGSVGLELDRRFERVFLTLAGAVGQRAPRAADGVHQSFGVRLTAVAAGGVVLASDVALGAFVSGLRQGAARDVAADAPFAGSALALVTAGVGAVFPVGDGWRAQGTASVDCPISGLGRNLPAGAGLAVSVLRVWP